MVLFNIDGHEVEQMNRLSMYQALAPHLIYTIYQSKRRNPTVCACHASKSLAVSQGSGSAFTSAHGRLLSQVSAAGGHREYPWQQGKACRV